MSARNNSAALLKEYEAANKFTIHLDDLNWQVGSILVGGSIGAVALSFNFASLKLAPALISSAGIIATISWFWLYRRNRAYSLVAIARMRVIEQQLDLEFHEDLAKAADNPSHSIVFPSLSHKPIEVPTPTGYETVKFLTAAIIAVLGLVILYVILSAVF